MYTLPLLLILTVGLSQAYAEIEYHDITIQGEEAWITGTAEKNTQVFYKIWNESGKLVWENSKITDVEGNFIDKISYKQLQGWGKFTGEFVHDVEPQEFSFEIVEPNLAIEIQMNDNDIIELVPQSAHDQMSQENERLTQENKELKDEIERLKDEMSRMQDEFFLTIKQQFEYFLNLSDK